MTRTRAALVALVLLSASATALVVRAEGARPVESDTQPVVADRDLALPTAGVTSVEGGVGGVTGTSAMAEMEARYAQLAAAAAAGSGLRPFAGRLGSWPIVGRISSPFGPRWGGFHNGVDIAAAAFTPVRAAGAGHVVTVGKPYLAYGDTATMVIVAHGGNFATMYVHLNDDRPPIVRVGERVAEGQIIAYNGSTGWSTGPHVHFMTIVNGRAVDPIPYLP